MEGKVKDLVTALGGVAVAVGVAGTGMVAVTVPAADAGAAPGRLDGVHRPTLPPLPSLSTGTSTPSPTPTSTPTTTPTATPTSTPTGPPPAGKKVVGMSSPASQWDQRVSEVGPQGLKARRIFADLTSTGRDQEALIRAAHDAGMLPVVSYKVPSVTNAINGSYDSWARAAASFLGSFGKPTVAVIWHEPHGDMTPAEYIALQERLVPILDPQTEVGPLLNGWLLDRRRADFESYMNANLLSQWDFVGIDTYQSGTQDAPGATYPGHRIDPLVDVLTDRGHATKRIAVGEYNGYDAQAIRFSGNEFLSEPTLWFACIWNNTGGKGVVLSGDRLTAYRDTKTDNRALW